MTLRFKANFKLAPCELELELFTFKSLIIFCGSGQYLQLVSLKTG